MTIEIDTTTRTVRAERPQYPLYGAEAFRLISDLWLELGWNLGHWSTFSWMGRQLLQLPDDALRLAEAVWRLRPSVVVETGVYDGGSALLFAALGNRVIAVEREVRPGVRQALEGRATLVEGDSAAPQTVSAVRSLIRPGDTVFVFLDSDHSRAHVLAELEAYSPLVTPGSYLVVADTILPRLCDTPEGEPQWSAGHPGAAIEDFLGEHAEFVVDPPEPLFDVGHDFRHLSYFSGGWLKRLRQ